MVLYQSEEFSSVTIPESISIFLIACFLAVLNNPFEKNVLPLRV